MCSSVRTPNDNNKELLSKQLEMMIDVSGELSVVAYHDTFRSRHVHTISSHIDVSHLTSLSSPDNITLMATVDAAVHTCLSFLSVSKLAASRF